MADALGAKRNKRKSLDKESDERDSKQVRRHGSSPPSPCTPAVRLVGAPGDQGLALLLCEGFLTFRVDGSREKSRVRGCYPGCQEEAVRNFFQECVLLYFAPLVWNLFSDPPLALPTKAGVDLDHIEMWGGYHSRSYSADELADHDGLVTVGKFRSDWIWTDPNEQAGFGISLCWNAYTVGDHLTTESCGQIMNTLSRMKNEGHERLRLDFRVIRCRVGCFVVGGDWVIETILGSDGILCDLRETSSWGPHPPQEDPPHPPQEDPPQEDPPGDLIPQLAHTEVPCEDRVSCDEPSSPSSSSSGRPSWCQAHLPVPPPPPERMIPLPRFAMTGLLMMVHDSC